MESATSTFNLVERAQQGDQEAFTRLFENYRRRLAVLVYYRLSNTMRRSVEVDDVLQETLLRAFRDIHRFMYRAPGSFLHWVSSIAEHVMADLARAEGRQKRHANEIVRFRSESNPDGPEPVDSKTPTRLLGEKERVLALLEKLDALPEEYRRVILMAKVEGLSTQEVAERLGKSREATALLLHRAIKRFRLLQESTKER